MVLKNNYAYLGIPPLGGFQVVLCQQREELEFRRDSYCFVRGMKTIDLDLKGLEMAVCPDTPCSLGSNF